MVLSGRRVASVLAAAAAALTWTSCKQTPCDPTNPDLSCYDAGGPPPYICTSAQVAISDASCQLTNCTAKTDYISGPKVQNWYSFAMPSTTDAKTLIHVNAGYQAPGTPVDLAIGLFKSDGLTALNPVVVDNHGSGAPKPIDIIVPASQAQLVAGNQVTISANDKNFNHTQNPPFDVANPYQVIACVLEDPDPYVGATPNAIALTGSTGNLQGSADGGYLSTGGRVDKFTVAVPGTGRQILYVHLTGGCVPDGGTTPGICLPPPNYLMAYSILDPTGLPVAGDYIKNIFLPIDLATARLAQKPGNYEIDVYGLDPNDPQHTTPGLGDLRVQYDLAVEVLQDLDNNEPNDSLSQAMSNPNDQINFSSPSAYPAQFGQNTQTKTGRISYVTDPDWFEINFAASGQPTMLHYKLTWGAAGTGRFPPLSPPPNARQLQVFKQVTTGATPTDRTNNCNNDSSICPKGYDANQTTQQILVSTFCSLYDPPDSGAAGIPRCILADRNEYLAFTNLSNFEGVIPVPAGTTQYFLVVQAQAVAPYDGWADDVDYQLTTEWLTSPEKAPQTLTIDSAASWQSPYSPGATALTGSIASGYGRIIYNQPDGGQGVRGPQDYDATVSQSDSYELDFGTGATDRAWELEWEVTNDASGNTVHDLALEVTFCDGTQVGALPPCAPGSPVLDSNGNPQVIAFDPGAGQWFNSQGQYGQYQNPWDHTVGTGVGSKTTTAANDYSCMCIQKPYAQLGKVLINVVGADRDSYQPANYTLHTAVAPYTTEMTAYDGGQLCPQLMTDGGGGCGFQ